MWSIPIIDISNFLKNPKNRLEIAKQIGFACQKYGFFYVVNHGIEEELQQRLEHLSKKFFALPLDVKNKIKMEFGSTAWRGYFPCGGELTSGKPDMKEGIYFGEEVDSNHSHVEAGLPFYGSNLFPDDEIPELRNTVIEYMKQVENLGHKIMAGIAISLGLEEEYFYKQYTNKPLQLFRIFNYPAVKRDLGKDEVLWGVGEHTDYGLLTILKQDNSGGLQVKTNSEWIEAPPIHNSFVCNIGDMLDRLTGGIYKSTPHRIKIKTDGNQLFFPFLFDSGNNSDVKKIEGIMSNINLREEKLNKKTKHGLSYTNKENSIRNVNPIFEQLLNIAI